MKRSDLTELQYITPIANLPSIIANGILSHRIANGLPHVSVASPDIQQNRRAPKCVPGGGPLHDYVNLYLCARNPMMYSLQERHLELCVLRVSTDVLDLDGVIIADGNAAADLTSFRPYPSGLERINRDLVFAEFRTDTNPIVKRHKKRVKCAEVLVPDLVPPRFILGAYISGEEALETLRDTGYNLTVIIDGHLFFRQGEQGHG